MKQQRPSFLLPLIIASQFAGTSLWFAGNAILPDLQRYLQLDTHAISYITTAVQLGFITGTLFFAVLSIADRFAPSNVFFLSCCIAAGTNLALVWFADSTFTVFALRFATGFFLAGIYPVGMKIAADWYEKGLGKALGYLVGALVLGTSFPHLLKSGQLQLPWETVLVCTSAFAFTGGLLVKLFIPDGPFRKQGSGFHPRSLIHIFRSRAFRGAAFGYFGHMWELYTFWAFLPVLIQLYNEARGLNLGISMMAFAVIAAGAVSSALGGVWSQRVGSAKVAWWGLFCSGCCCALSLLVPYMVLPVFVVFVVFWSLSVIADSPQFSALVAQTAPPEHKGTALTFITSIGFSITIVSMFAFDYLLHVTDFSHKAFIMMVPGPIFGLIALSSSGKSFNKDRS